MSSYLIRIKPNSVNTKHLYNICTMSDRRRRRWADAAQILYKCFVFAGYHVEWINYIMISSLFVVNDLTFWLQWDYYVLMQIESIPADIMITSWECLIPLYTDNRLSGGSILTVMSGVQWGYLGIYSNPRNVRMDFKWPYQPFYYVINDLFSRPWFYILYTFISTR